MSYADGGVFRQTLFGLVTRSLHVYFSAPRRLLSWTSQALSSVSQQNWSANGTATTSQGRPKRRFRWIPEPQIQRILQRYVTGESIREISREEHRSREAITRIVRSSEMSEFIERSREGVLRPCRQCSFRTVPYTGSGERRCIGVSRSQRNRTGATSHQ